MLAAASKCKLKQSISSLFSNFSFSRHHSFNGFIGARIIAKRILNFSSVRNPRYSQSTICIVTIPVGVFWVWPFLVIFRNSSAITRTVTTQVSPASETVDDILNEIGNSSVSALEFSNLLRNLCIAGDLGAASRILQALHVKNIFLGLQIYIFLIKAAGERKDVSLLSQCFKDLIVSGEFFKSAFYFLVAKVFREKDDVAELLLFVREISEVPLLGGATPLNRIIFAFAKYGQVDKALLIFKEMKSLKCQPDLVTYNTVLGILGRCGRLQDMVDEFASMKMVNLIPDIFSYNTLINNARKFGRIDLCMVFFKEMTDKGIQPDLLTYTPLIDCLGRAGNIEEALNVFEQMKHRQIRPSVYIFRGLIHNLKKMGKLELALELTKEMNSALSNRFSRKDFKRRK